ncbi:AsmA-like C-terminal region-containing protein [Corallincola platygyrae]|uniref:AsmA-like C-terminal region-containing protein n=1 Tax=Corallincola platygyrae TaxID=1193278 RepID=A0ABW4XMA2_9GAMM
MKISIWLKRIFIAILALPFVAITGFLLWFEADKFRSDLEQLVADATPLTLSIQSPIEYSLGDPYLITFRDIDLRYQETTILGLERFALRIDEISLFKREITLAGISLDRPEVDLSPEMLDQLVDDFSEPDEIAQPVAVDDSEAAIFLSALSLKQLDIDGLSLRWEDLDKPIRLKELTVSVTDWDLIRDAAIVPENWHLAIYLFAEEVSWQQHVATDLTVHGLMSEASVQITDASINLLSGELALKSTTSLTDNFATRIHELTLSNIKLSDSILGLTATPSAEQEPKEQAVHSEHQPIQIPKIDLPISSLIVETATLSNIHYSSDVVSTGAKVEGLTFEAKQLAIISDSQIAPERLSGELSLAIDRFSYPPHTIEAIGAKLSIADGAAKLTESSLKALDGTIELAATAALEQGLPLVVDNLTVSNVKLSDELWRSEPSDDGTDSKAQDGESQDIEIEKQAEPAKADEAETLLPLRSLNIKQVTINDLALTLSEPSFATENLSLALSELAPVQEYHLIGYPDILKQPFVFTLDGAKIEAVGHKVDTLNVSLSGGQPFKLDQVKVTGPAAQIDLSGNVETQNSELPFSIISNAKQVDLSLLDPLDTGYPLAGRVNIKTEIKGEAASVDALISSLNGPIHIDGQNFTLQNIDIDTTLDNFLDSQELTLTDVGAFALLGPIGLAVSKAKAISGAAAGALAGGDTKFADADLHLVFTDGVMKFENSAIATQEHRIALFGQINLPQSQFEKLTTTVLDEKACVRLARSIDGPFSGPDVQVASAITGTVTGLFSGVFSGTEKYFGDGCEPVYQGRVKPPKQFDFEANAEKLQQEENALLEQLPEAARFAELEMKKAQAEMAP